MKLLVIGGGNMGGAIVRGVIAQGVLAPDEIGVVEVDAAKRAEFKRLGCRVFESIASAGAMNAAEMPPPFPSRGESRSTGISHRREGEGRGKGVEQNDRFRTSPLPHPDPLPPQQRGGRGEDLQIMLAVKPQMFAAIAQSLHDAQLVGSRVFISIMAGIESGRIHQSLGPGARIVRCMPNTPCQIGKGMTAIALGKGSSEGDEDLARQIFDAIGKTVMVDESMLNAVTAVSASGPAYVFLMAEAMQTAAEEVDLPPNVARMLVTQMIVGAAAMLDQKGSDAASLRKAVTSPGGTTAAALRVFEERGFEQAIIDAVRAARDRGVELNRLSGQ